MLKPNIALVVSELLLDPEIPEKLLIGIVSSRMRMQHLNEYLNTSRTKLNTEYVMKLIAKYRYRIYIEYCNYKPLEEYHFAEVLREKVSEMGLLLTKESYQEAKYLSNHKLEVPPSLSRLKEAEIISGFDFNQYIYDTYIQ